MMQCRTEPVINSTATRFSGFAFGVLNDSVVEVNLVASLNNTMYSIITVL